MLTKEIKDILMKRFPPVELSYDRILHNKVYADAFMIIPSGPKAFMWLTYYNNKNICLILTLNNNNNINNIELYSLSFNSELSIGTLIYGTIFTIENRKHFSCENIHYYKNINVEDYDFIKKLNLFKNLFSSEISQKFYSNNFIIPGIPIYCPNFNTAYNYISTLPYNTYGIKFINTKKYNYSLGIYKNINETIYEGIFKVKATIQPDIYNIYCYNPNNFDKPYDIAYISNYKNSVMMNNLFRNIKENKNLDLLEESDDEEDFENISDDKYVDLNKSCYMKCIYNKKFRKWEPIQVINNKIKLITHKDAQFIEKKV